MNRRSVQVLGLSLLGLIGAGGCFSPTSVADGADSDSARCISPEEAARMADQVLELVNLERAAEGLTPVVESAILTKIAEEYACQMIEDGFFAHHEPGSGDGPAERATEQDYFFLAIGENLAAGQESPAEVMEVWMESPTHRAIILDPNWLEVGIAVRSGGTYAVYWVQEFGQPAEE